jgi:hypothetical protein
MQTDEEMGDHAKRYAKSIYHPVGTCRMGSNDDAVVDPSLRVRGVPRLRICDASVMPKIVRGNTQCTNHHDRRTRRRPYFGRAVVSSLQAKSFQKLKTPRASYPEQRH